MKKPGDIVYKFDRMERDDNSRIADGLNRAVESLSDRRAIYRSLVVLGLSNLILWLGILIFPGTVRGAFERLIGLNGKIGVAALGIPLGIGLYFSYSLFRLKFPDIEEQNIESAPMGSFNYHTHSNKRWMIWFFSTVGGVLNLLLLILVDIGLTGG
jgi:hypothetical protein